MIEQKTVYVVTTSDDDDHEVVGAFSSEDLADDFISRTSPEYKVSQHIVDAVFGLEGDMPVVNAKYYRIYVHVRFEPGLATSAYKTPRGVEIDWQSISQGKIHLGHLSSFLFGGFDVYVSCSYSREEAMEIAEEKCKLFQQIKKENGNTNLEGVLQLFKVASDDHSTI